MIPLIPLVSPHPHPIYSKSRKNLKKTKSQPVHLGIVSRSCVFLPGFNLGIGQDSLCPYHIRMEATCSTQPSVWCRLKKGTFRIWAKGNGAAFSGL